MSTVVETPQRRGWISIAGWLLTVVATVASFPVMRAEWFLRHDTGGEDPATGIGLTAGLTQGLALAVLAASLVMLVFGRFGRRLLAVVIAALAAWMAILAVTARPAGEVSITGEEKMGPVNADPTVNLYLYGGLVALTVLGALITFLRPGAAQGAARREGVVEEDKWVVLDRGGDPTTA